LMGNIQVCNTSTRRLDNKVCIKRLLPNTNRSGPSCSLFFQLIHHVLVDSGIFHDRSMGVVATHIY